MQADCLIGETSACLASSEKVFFYFVGLILIASAIVKFWSLATDAFVDVRVGLPKEILWVSIAIDFILGIENFRIRNHRVLTVIDAAVLTGFALFGCTRMLLGFRSCGCSGVLDLPSWFVASLDVSIIIGLLSTSRKRLDAVAGIRQLVQWWKSSSPAMQGCRDA